MVDRGNAPASTMESATADGAGAHVKEHERTLKPAGESARQARAYECSPAIQRLTAYNVNRIAANPNIVMIAARFSFQP
jgi:hypothetical protein